MNTTEKVLRGFGLKPGMFIHNVFESFVKGGASVAVTEGDEMATVELSIKVPVVRLGTDMLPIMAAFTLLNDVAQGETVDVDTLAARYVGRHWFPKAAEDYVADHAEKFIDDETGAPRFDPERLFELVMKDVFWPLCDTEPTAPDAFEDKVWEAVAESVWQDEEHQVREAAADARENRSSYAYNGVRQSDFL